MGSHESVTWAIWPQFLLPEIMGIQDSVTGRIVYGDTYSCTAIMGSEDSVKGPYCLWPHILLPKVVGSQDSLTSPYCLWPHTLFHCDHGL
ncbi:hypothetical protein Bpfe_002236 [Biomphalaria pfeifferi]|uniref:Uncharacterized protein n=1 Tax=Biomphalaria pfeifferi TaxID=112525 RepID=A0AAD8C9G3_BIOPF|nr:hypothetical protein Bpfe_002193 [Biomphalaria pfeifferi]KAK0068301.1 hypothetical protein Bpfe_002236 [Biomphalaria pfeifferi]